MSPPKILAQGFFASLHSKAIKSSIRPNWRRQEDLQAPPQPPGGWRASNRLTHLVGGHTACFLSKRSQVSRVWSHDDHSHVGVHHEPYRVVPVSWEAIWPSARTCRSTSSTASNPAKLAGHLSIACWGPRHSGARTAVATTLCDGIITVRAFDCPYNYRLS